jgi:hypothetical protein
MATNRFTSSELPYRAAAGLSAAMILALCGTLWASDPAALIPADAAAVLALPHLERSAKKLETYLRKHDKGFSGLDLDEVQRGFNLPDGAVDFSEPIFLVLTRPVRHETAFVLVFTPADSDAFAERVSHRDDSIRRCSGPEGAYTLMMRQGTAIVGLKRKAVRLFRRLPPERSLSEALDDRQRAMLESGDVFVHIPLARLRAHFDPFIRLAAAGIRLGVAAQHDPETIAGAAEVADWLVGGILAVIDQMETATLALDFDGRTFRLAHHHTFTPSGSVAEYLGQVKRPGQAGWTTLPDRPFFLLGALDWQCPPEASVAMRTYRHLFRPDSALTDTPLPKRRQIIDAARACYGQTLGSNFMLASAGGKLLPFQIFGGYVMEDPEEGLRSLVFLQENADEVVSSFMGGPFFGKFHRRTREGLEFYELQLDFQQINLTMHRQAALALYGRTARLQQAVAGSHQVVYSMGLPSTGVHDMVTALDTGRHVGKNPLVRRIVARLPDHPNAIVLADLGRCRSLLPAMMLLRSTMPGRPRAVGEQGTTDYSAPPGPMLGWACTLGPHFLTGHLAMDADDLIRAVRLLRASGKGT